LQAWKKWRHCILPKEIVLSIDHQALKFINNQEKLSKARHSKCVEVSQNFSFMLKLNSGQANKAADALSRRVSFFATMSVEVVGFEVIKD
jgi:hypothetical protein